MSKYASENHLLDAKRLAIVANNLQNYRGSVLPEAQGRVDEALRQLDAAIRGSLATAVIKSGKTEALSIGIRHLD